MILDIYLELVYLYECMLDQCEEAANATSKAENFDLKMMESQLNSAKESTLVGMNRTMGILPRIIIETLSIETDLNAIINLRKRLVTEKWKATNAFELELLQKLKDQLKADYQAGGSTELDELRKEIEIQNNTIKLYEDKYFEDVNGIVTDIIAEQLFTQMQSVVSEVVYNNVEILEDEEVQQEQEVFEEQLKDLLASYLSGKSDSNQGRLTDPFTEAPEDFSDKELAKTFGSYQPLNSLSAYIVNFDSCKSFATEVEVKPPLDEDGVENVLEQRTLQSNVIVHERMMLLKNFDEDNCNKNKLGTRCLTIEVILPRTMIEEMQIDIGKIIQQGLLLSIKMLQRYFRSGGALHKCEYQSLSMAPLSRRIL